METTIPNPTPEQVRWHMQQARRMRSEAVHELLKSACESLTSAFRTRTPASRGIVVAEARHA